VARCGLSPVREAQDAEVVGDELKALKANGFAKGETTARETLTVGREGEHG
jgi:hypothetical protein